MTQVVDAVYENGVFKPIGPIEGFSDRDRVQLTISAAPQTRKKNPFEDWVGDMSDEDAAEMIRVIDEEFEQIDPNDWK